MWYPVRDNETKEILCYVDKKGKVKKDLPEGESRALYLGEYIDFKVGFIMRYLYSMPRDRRLKILDKFCGFCGSGATDCNCDGH